MFSCDWNFLHANVRYQLSELLYQTCHTIRDETRREQSREYVFTMNDPA